LQEKNKATNYFVGRTKIFSYLQQRIYIIPHLLRALIHWCTHPGRQITPTPDYPDARLPRRQISPTPDYPDARLTRRQITPTPDYPDARLPGLLNCILWRLIFEHLQYETSLTSSKRRLEFSVASRLIGFIYFCVWNLHLSRNDIFVC